ncbi:MAG: hypothetical protein RLZZ450_6337 [Pseudomonadota bacterium]|jgi:hypothetical protein
MMPIVSVMTSSTKITTTKTTTPTVRMDGGHHVRDVDVDRSAVVGVGLLHASDYVTVDEVGRNTVKRMLAEAGIAPAPERRRRTSWKTFLRAHWEAIAAADFFIAPTMRV